MTSPLVIKLLAKLKASTDHVERALLLAELGCYWARVGEFDEAERIRQELRRDFGDGRNARVSILIMVIEALQLYYRDLNPSARDRMSRANLLSKGFRERGLIALTSAWMAHFEFNRARFDSMAVELRSSIDTLDVGDDSAECRMALVFGDAYLLAGVHVKSQVWYERARIIASRTGDHAALGAMTYNRAALRVARARYERLSEKPSGVDASLLRLDVESAINYQSIAQLRSLDHLLQTAKVGHLLIQDQAAAAAPHIEDLLACEDVVVGSAQRVLLSSDFAFVLAKTGRIDDAVRQMGDVLRDLPDSLPTDDLCLILGSLRDAASICKKERQRAELDAQLRATVLKHEAVVAGLRSNLSALEPVAD